MTSRLRKSRRKKVFRENSERFVPDAHPVPVYIQPPVPLIRSMMTTVVSVPRASVPDCRVLHPSVPVIVPATTIAADITAVRSSGRVTSPAKATSPVRVISLVREVTSHVAVISLVSREVTSLASRVGAISRAVVISLVSRVAISHASRVVISLVSRVPMASPTSSRVAMASPSVPADSVPVPLTTTRTRSTV